LELNDVGLRDAVKRIATHFDLPMGINSAAFKQAEERVSGKIENERIELTLNKMLEPIGLRVIVKYEMVLVVPLEE
jgi:2-phosphoglycerate kinase